MIKAMLITFKYICYSLINKHNEETIHKTGFLKIRIFIPLTQIHQLLKAMKILDSNQI